MSAAASIVGALGVIWLSLLVLLVIWRLCNGREAAKAQASHVVLDDAGTEIPRYVITSIEFNPGAFIRTQEGMFTLNERNEWVPFGDREAA